MLIVFPLFCQNYRYSPAQLSHYENGEKCEKDNNVENEEDGQNDTDVTCENYEIVGVNLKVNNLMIYTPPALLSAEEFPKMLG